MLKKYRTTDVITGPCYPNAATRGDPVRLSLPIGTELTEGPYEGKYRRFFLIKNPPDATRPWIMADTDWAAEAIGCGDLVEITALEPQWPLGALVIDDMSGDDICEDA